MEKEDFQQLLKEWQTRLRLQHWEVKAGLHHSKDFDGGVQRGQNSYNKFTGESYIKICHPDDYPDGPFKQDIEVSLIHELLHLHFCYFEPEEEQQEFVAWERCIETVARILVGLKRGGKNEFS